MLKNEKLDLTLLLLVAILLSIYLFFRTYVISWDGAFQYIPIAKDFASGLYEKALSQGQQPLYSFFVALLSQSLSDYEMAGKLVSSFFGILMIFPVYLLGKQIFDKKVAFFSALLLAIHPYIRRFSGDVLKESTYLFFLAIAILFAWWTIQRSRTFPYLFIPLFSAIAYLVRPDGVEVLLAVFIYILFIKKFNAPGEKWVVVSLLVLSSAILFLPYLLHVKEITGMWTLSKAKSVQGLLGWGGMGGEGSFIRKILMSLKTLNVEILRLYHPLYIFLLIVGLWKKMSSHLKVGEGFLVPLFVLHYAVLFLLVLNLSDRSGDGTLESLFSGRHVLPLLLVSMFWVGEGFLAIHHWVYKKFESFGLFHRRPLNKRPSLVLVALIILVSAIVLPKTLKPQRYERLTEKWAGMWIKNQSREGTTIFATVPRVAYYADRNYEHIDLNKDRIDKIKASMVGGKAVYLVVREEEISGFHGNAEAIKKDYVELARFEGKGMEKIIVYRMVQ